MKYTGDAERTWSTVKQALLGGWDISALLGSAAGRDVAGELPVRSQGEGLGTPCCQEKREVPAGKRCRARRCGTGRDLIAAIWARLTCIKPFPQLQRGEANVTRPEGHNHPVQELGCPGKSTALLSSKKIGQISTEVPSRRRANLPFQLRPCNTRIDGE